ncbi:hypothetical protein SDC9_129000 [bioreactor metagenome]|uniref:Uncharacterized protein n=1 Tax=bioreactor metagenome TaxID=1076179 RepID=A0A645CZE3_9ZZZZ
MALVVFEDTQHIPAGRQLLFYGGDEPGQLGFDELTPGAHLFFRFPALLEVDQNGEDDHHRGQERQDGEARERAEQDHAGFDQRVGRVDLRGHVHARRGEHPLQTVPLVLVHADIL